MVKYLKIFNDQLTTNYCEENSFEDALYDIVGYNYGTRHSNDGRYLIIEDNCLEGNASKINSKFYSRGILYGVCVIVKSNYESLQDEDLRYLYDEVQIIG